VSNTLVSVNVNMPVEEVKICGNDVQTMTGVKFVVHSTWNKLFVEADHVKVTLVPVEITLLNVGGGNTKIVNAFVAVTGGKPLSVTVVTNLNAEPASPAPGVQVMMPLVSIDAVVDGVGKLAN